MSPSCSLYGRWLHRIARSRLRPRFIITNWDTFWGYSAPSITCWFLSCRTIVLTLLSTSSCTEVGGGSTKSIYFLEVTRKIVNLENSPVVWAAYVQWTVTFASRSIFSTLCFRIASSKTASTAIIGTKTTITRWGTTALCARRGSRASWLCECCSNRKR